MISANFLLPQWVKTHWEVYVEARGRRCAGSGAVARRERRCSSQTTTAPPGSTASVRDSPYRHYYSQLGFKLIRAGRANLFKTDPGLPDSSVTTDSMLEQLVIAGTPNQVTEELLAFREQVGDFGTLLYCGLDWVDPGVARRSMELMAEVVMPAVNRAIG